MSADDAWDDDADAWTKVRENRARRAACRQGYHLHRNRRRDPYAIGYGTYTLKSGSGQASDLPAQASLSAIESFLHVQKGTDDVKSQKAVRPKETKKKEAGLR